MYIDKYLARIGYTGEAAPNRQTLFELHRLHMLHVPFENLDIALGIPIALQLPKLFDKIVNRKRGGFCYELNGLFSWLLLELGFDVKMLEARVYDGGEPGQPFDHLALLVKLEENWLADVGFGDSFFWPLQFGASPAEQGIDHFKISDRNNRHIVLRQRQGESWDPQYEFDLQFHELEEFNTMCRYHQTSPKSSFTQKRVCSLATDDGRVTLSNNRLIIRNGFERTEIHTNAADEIRLVLSETFGIEIEGSMDKLIPVSQ